MVIKGTLTTRLARGFAEALIPDSGSRPGRARETLLSDIALAL